MRQLQPVIWAKGTFLTPQHLQAQDRFVESTLQFRLDALNFRPWGFRELRLNEEALAEGTIAISRASGLLPDGLPFDIPDADPAPLPKQFQALFEAEQSTLDLYLAIPRLRDRGLNVSGTQHHADTRFVAEVAMLRDENTGTTEKPVQIARKNFRLLGETESREGYSVLRLARIKRSSAGTFQLDSTFVPPLLDIAASDYLTSILRRCVEILSAKSSILAGNRGQKSQDLANFTASDIANFWLLYTVNNHFPLLRHFYETRRGHPETVFAALASLAGSLTTFYPKIQPRDLPLYDHDELGACFTNLDEQLRILLEASAPSNFVSLPLKLAQPFIYATSLDDDKYLFETRMYLAVSAELNEAELIKKVPTLVRVAAGTRLDTLIRHSLSGIQLTHLPKPPGAIPVKLKYQYFSLNQSGTAWEEIGKARSLAAYVPGEIKNPQLELIILLPRSQ